MNAWMEKEVSTVCGIEELGYPKRVTDALICLLGSLDGVVEKEHLPKIVGVNSLDTFIKDIETAIRAAENELQWRISILPDGAPEDCEIIMYTNDARDFLKDLFESMCARDRCIQVAVGFSPITFAAHKAGQELIEDRCVIYVFNDRASKFADIVHAYGHFDGLKLPFHDVCYTEKVIEALNQYAIKNDYMSNNNSSLYDGIIQHMLSEASWADRIRARDVLKLLNDESLAKNFIHACRTIAHNTYPVFVDRTRTPIGTAISSLAKVYQNGGVMNPNVGAANVIRNYYLLPSVDVCATFDNDYDEYDDIDAFVPTFIINIADPNFINNVLETAKIASVVSYNTDELSRDLEGEVILSLESLKAKMDEFINNSNDDEDD